MRRHWYVRIAGFLLIALIVIAGFGQAVLQLWNWLMPSLFGLPAIGFWQAVGLLALSWILFGSWRGFGFRSRRWRHGMHERWERMTPEERENFRKTMAGRCGRKEADASSS